jgi:hypothetical protein
VRFLRQSTASQEILLGPFVAAADGTAQTGLTIANTDIQLLKGGATAEGSKNSGGGTHIAGGRYSAVLDATDTNTVGILEVSVNPGSGIPWNKSYYVLEEAVYDQLFAASATGAVPVASIANNAITAASIAGDAITAAKIADGAIDAATFAANAITSTVLAADAITAAKVAADVGTEIGTAVWATTTRLLTAGTNIALAKGTGVTGFNDLSAAQVNAEVDTALVDIHLDHLLAVTYDPASKPGAADALLNELVESDGGVARYTANALEQAPSGTGASASAIADEVQTRTIAAVTVVNGLAANVITAAATAADFTTEIQSGLATAAELAKVPKSDGTASWNATALAAMQQQAEDALAVYDGPTNAEMVARTLAAADYATASAQATAQADLDTLTGADGVTLATSQPNYAPATAAAATAIEADTQNIQSRLPDALVSGSIKANITHVIGDAVQQNGATDTNWGGAP